MRPLRLATALLTASSLSHRATPALAFASRRAFAASIVAAASASASTSSSSAAAAAEGGEAGECNATAPPPASSPSSSSRAQMPPLSEMYDAEYPGTAVQRLRAVHERVAVLASDGTLNGPWEDVRRRILWAGGLRDLPDAVPGQGYTGHSFNDFNHVDLTTMNDDQSDNLNDGSVKGIAIGNRLGPGIRIASIEELGPGGSWSTCAIGCNKDPPSDVAHVQFRSRVAFKLVWVPNEEFDTFVLVDDAGKLLARGTPSDGPEALPSRREREMNYRIMMGSKYAVAAEGIAREQASSTGNATASS